MSGDAAGTGVDRTRRGWTLAARIVLAIAIVAYVGEVVRWYPDVELLPIHAGALLAATAAWRFVAKRPCAVTLAGALYALVTVSCLAAGVVNMRNTIPRLRAETAELEQQRLGDRFGALGYSGPGRTQWLVIRAREGDADARRTLESLVQRRAPGFGPAALCLLRIRGQGESAKRLADAEYEKPLLWLGLDSWRWWAPPPLQEFRDVKDAALRERRCTAAADEAREIVMRSKSDD
jgi:hypothetical protein